ncbi:hypothetical protein KNO15_13825 [Leifsonia shinshuensis]|uniref:hypothetical protein n=1 Tax=Leifsonia shinshuensis TaxID=150026 RepID=UPI001F50D7A7|nr:hypothetical protein [Leifsonia shinshuensis]MCI0157775.1 hypothetical protein [Leifsonia shinshuensis]
MTDHASYLSDFTRFVSSRSTLLSHRDPEVVLGAYSDLIAEIDKGYDDEPEEYDNDMSIRSLIQELLDCQELRSHPEFAQFSAAVAKMDTELQALLTPDAKRPAYGDDQDQWWRVRLPLRASGNFREYMTLAWGYTAEDSHAQP